MNKKKVFLFIAAFVVLAVAGYFGYNKWLKKEKNNKVNAAGQNFSMQETASDATNTGAADAVTSAADNRLAAGATTASAPNI